MKTQTVRKLVFAAVLAALTCVATLVIQIPVPAVNGYVNLGDCVVLLCAWILGPWYGLAAAGIGSMLADVLSGYAFYAPATLILKALMALAAALIPHGKLAGRAAGAVAAELIMGAGYWLYAAWFLHTGMAAALAGVPANLIQGAMGLVGGLIIYQALFKTKALRKLQLQ